MDGFIRIGEICKGFVGCIMRERGGGRREAVLGRCG